MSIIVYRRYDTDAVFIAHGTIGSWPFFTLKAVKDTINDLINVQNLSKTSSSESDFFEIKGVGYEDFIDDEGESYGNNTEEVVNALNNIFNNLPKDSVEPVITSPLAITVADGDVVNYRLTAINATAFGWGALPAGLAFNTVTSTHLLGIITDGSGVYNLTMTAASAYGSDTQTLTITVTTGFINSKSIVFEASEYLTAAANTSNPLYRAGNGSGASDAWTISLWFKPGTSTNSKQTILYFGGDGNSDGKIKLGYNGNRTTGKKIFFEYGSNSDYLRFETTSDSVAVGNWHHILITYDGGTTGNSAGSLNDYYGRFEIFIDNVSQNTTKTNGNNGFTGEIVTDEFLLGESGTGAKDNMRNNCGVDEFSLWASDQTSNRSSIYSNGSPDNLSNLGTPPDHWWRMGDGDTFPLIEDNIGSIDFTMTNMVALDIVNDTPV